MDTSIPAGPAGGNPEEIRTRCLIVEDHAGRQRIVLATDPVTGNPLLTLLGAEGEVRATLFLAGDQDDPPLAGLELGGEVDEPRVRLHASRDGVALAAGTNGQPYPGEAAPWGA